MRPNVTSIVTATATIAALTAGQCGPFIASSAAAACPDVTIVAVPGTTETNPDANPHVPAGLLQKVIEPVKKARLSRSKDDDPVM